MTSAQQARRPFGELLRQWREHRRLSQLELSTRADVSARHLSFIETGRSAPSREMVLRLCEQLNVPLRERNVMLVAAGYAPAYTQSVLASPQLSAIMSAVRRVLSAQQPYPAVVVDRHWNVIEQNDSFDIFTRGVSPTLLESPLNIVRLALHPDGLASRIANMAEMRWHILCDVRRRFETTADPQISALYDELRSYPGPASTHDPRTNGVVVPMRIRDGDQVLSFMCTISTFSMPLDVTVAELEIETFFPADAVTAEALRRERVGANGAR